MARALTGTSRSGRFVTLRNRFHIAGILRPSANCDMSGTPRLPSQRSIEQRSTPQTCATLMARRLRSCRASSVEFRISATSSSARVSVSRRVVSEYRRAFSSATAACAASEPMSDAVSGVTGHEAVRCTANAPSTRSPTAIGYAVTHPSPRRSSAGASTDRASRATSVQKIGSRCWTTQPIPPSPGARVSCSSAASAGSPCVSVRRSRPVAASSPQTLT